MKKPLELVVPPLLDKVGRLAEPGYIVNRRAIPAWHVPHLIHEKRLTASELAAEYWRAACIDECFMTAEDMDSPQYDRAFGQTMTLKRFATLPNYDEVA